MADTVTLHKTVQNLAIYNDVHFDWPTFFGQLVGFAVIVFVLVRYAIPPVRRMMVGQQDTVRRQLADSERATARLAEARRAHQKAVADAATEAARIREDARADAAQISAQLREQATAEVARVQHQGRDQIVLTRAQLISRLKADLGATALAQAERQVRDHLGSTQARSDSVDRFLDELEAMVAGAGRTRDREF
jgi:F-type H+-transporting ATPase subunit delta